jgi:hypothetical protein
VYRAINASSTQQRTVCRVNDRINLQSGNISAHHLNHHLIQTIVVVIILLCTSVFVWYFLDGMRAREVATAVAKEYCRQVDLQFLDGTVNLRSIALRRTIDGLAFRRTFEFQYTRDDNIRHHGAVVMMGKQVENLVLHHEEEIDRLPD